MTTIISVVLGCLLLWLAATSPRFRRFSVMVVVLFAISAGIWLLPGGPPEKQAIKFAVPQPASYEEFMEVPAAELAVTGVSIQRRDAAGEGYKISSKIENRSKSATLSSIKMKIAVSDCRASARCVVVGERTFRIKAEVPSGQTKDFTYELTGLRGVPSRDDLTWNWDVTASYAK